MLKKLNKKGSIEAAVLIGLGLMFGAALQETASNGVLKKNGQRIWCKMLNKDAVYCDAMYK